MKFLLSALLITLSMYASAQSWPEKGAVWHYQISSIGGYGLIKVVYEKDTLIENRLCAKLSALSYFYGITGPDGKAGLIEKKQLPDKFTYYNGDTVFYLVDQQFKPLYCFNANPGDSWELGGQTNDLDCSGTSVKVDSIGTTTIQSHLLKWVSVSPKENSGLALNGKIVERIGTIDGYLFPVINCCDPNMICDFDYIRFTCYQDDDFPSYNVTMYDCEYYLKTNIPEVEFFQGLYPVPTKNKLNVISKQVSSVIILSIDGKIVCEPEISGNQIDLSELESGIYLVILKNKSGKIYSQKIIKR